MTLPPSAAASSPAAASPAASPAAPPVELTRARAARRVVALLLVVAALAACVLAALDVRGGVAGQARLLVTIAFLLLGPGWAAAGFLRRAPAAHVWLLAVGVGVATTLLVAQVMVMTAWQPIAALYLVAVVSVPLLLRHAVVAQ